MTAKSVISLAASIPMVLCPPALPLTPSCDGGDDFIRGMVTSDDLQFDPNEILDAVET